MKPIENEHKGYYQIGDYVNNIKHMTGKIIAFARCENEHNCSPNYVNHDICGGYKRVIDGTPMCMFFSAYKDGLSYLGLMPGVPTI